MFKRICDELYHIPIQTNSIIVFEKYNRIQVVLLYKTARCFRMLTYLKFDNRAIAGPNVLAYVVTMLSQPTLLFVSDNRIITPLFGNNGSNYSGTTRNMSSPLKIPECAPTRRASMAFVIEIES